MTQGTISITAPDLITEHRIQILMRVLATSGTLAGLVGMLPFGVMILYAVL